MSKRASLDDAVRSMAEEAVDERVRGVRGDEGESPFSDTPAAPIPEAQTLANLFTNVPANEGYYIKIYKRSPLPPSYGNKPMYLYDIQQPEAVNDIEMELMRLARLNGWTDGVYEVKLYRGGDPGVKQETRISLQVPTAPLSPPPGATQGQADPYVHLANTAKLLKDLTTLTAPTSPSATALNPENAVKAVTDAYRAGIETARSATPAPTTPPVDLAGIITAMKSLIPRPEPAPDPMLLVEKLATLFKPTVTTEQNPLAILVTLKEAGLLGQPAVAQSDPLEKAIGLLTTLIPLIQSLGGGGADKTSMGVELIRTLGPQVSKVVGDVTSTINRVVEAKTGGPVRRPTPVTVTSASPNPTPNPEQPAPVLEAPMLPIFRPIKEAVEARDVNYFPKLRELILQYGNEGVYEDLIDGKFTLDQLVEYIRPLGGDFFASEPARIYFTDFLTWARAQRASELVATCQGCMEEFLFASKEELAQDPKCPECGGTLLAPGESIAEPASSSHLPLPDEAPSHEAEVPF